MRRLWLLVFAGCTLTPIPDVTSAWSPACATSKRTCSVDFKRVATTETSVELRGDFAPGAWAAGIPMVVINGFWETSITVPWGATVQYKFYVNGTTWETDASNPKTIDNGGNTNSLLENIECVTWVCAE